MPKIIKDGFHYVILLILLAYAMPWILEKLQIAQKLTTRIFYQWLITFIIYLGVFVIADKILHKQFGI